MPGQAAAMPAPMGGAPVWVTADSAYYSEDAVERCRALKRDFSISVTDPDKRRPILERLEGLPPGAWTGIGGGEEAIPARRRPARRSREHDYVAARRKDADEHGKPKRGRAVILVSRADLSPAEPVLRRRRRRGRENYSEAPSISMGPHHPRCRSFLANKAIRLRGRPARIPLRMIQYRAPPKHARCRSLETIILDVMRTGAEPASCVRRRARLFRKNTCRRPDRLLRAVIYFDDEHPRPARSPAFQLGSRLGSRRGTGAFACRATARNSTVPAPDRAVFRKKRPRLCSNAPGDSRTGGNSSDQIRGRSGPFWSLNRGSGGKGALVVYGMLGGEPATDDRTKRRQFPLMVRRCAVWKREVTK